MLSRQISYKGYPVFYEVTGEGPAVMLVHGFGEDHHIWEGTIAHLKSSFTVMYADIPGSGASPFNESLFSMDDFAEVMNAIAEAENTNKLSMIGHSMGGYITLAFWEKYPEKLEAFGLFHSTAYADSAEKKEARTRSIRFIEENGAAPFLKQSTPALFSDAYREAHPETPALLLEYGKTFSGAALIRYYESMIARPDRTHVLKNASVPVLFVLGKKDQAIPFPDSLPQTHLPPFSYVEILESSAHMGMYEEKDRSMAILEKFLREIAVYKE